MCDSARDGRGSEEFVTRNSGERASGPGAHDTAASALRSQTYGGDGVQRLEQSRIRQPMELDVLTNGDVSQIAGVLLGDCSDGAQLLRSDNATRQPDAHHEVLG